jgi:hypothetical protein
MSAPGYSEARRDVDAHDFGQDLRIVLAAAR